MAMLRIIATALVLSGAFALDQVKLAPDVKAGTHPLLSFRGRQSLGDPKSAKKMQPAHEFLAQQLTQKVAATNPGFHYTLYKPEGQPKGSVILLSPWGGAENWWVEWLGGNFATLKQKYRVLEAVGRNMMQTDGSTYRAWYQYQNWDAELPVTADFDFAVKYVHSLIEQEYRIVEDYSRIVVVGYSQGAVLALESGLRFPHPLGLVFSQRGILLESRKRTHPFGIACSRSAKHCKGFAATPYIMTTGAYDRIYPWRIVQHDSKLLRDAKLLSFLADIPMLDHQSRSEKENSIAMKSVSVVLSHAWTMDSDRKLERSLAKVDDWTDQP